MELDHARLAMLAVLLSGAIGAGAGAGAGVYLNAHDGFSAVSIFAPFSTFWIGTGQAGQVVSKNLARLCTKVLE